MATPTTQQGPCGGGVDHADAEDLELIDIMKTIEAEQQKATDDLAKQQKETDDEITKEEAALRQAILGGVDPRGSLGPRFQRDAGGGQNKAYKNLTGRQEKADFRRRWAQAQLEQVVESREREDEMKQVDTTKGDMVSIKELIKREGAADAKKYIEKCAALGPPWLFWDPMWERYECMVMTRSHQDVFTKAWRLRCQRMDGNRAESEQSPTKKAVITAEDIYIYIYTHIWINKYTYVCMCVYIYIYIYIHTYTYT